MQDFLLNTDYSMLQIPSDNLIPQTTGVFMLHTIKMSFNVQNRTFDLGYLNYEVDTSVRNSIVHCYYLSIDTRLSQFIEFLVTIDPKQERQSKINNIRQITLKVTFARKRQVFYNLIIKGDTTGVMTFKPSEFSNCEKDVESDLSSLEPLINSIINEDRYIVPENQLSFYLWKSIASIKQLTRFTVQYTKYDYFKREKNHVYFLVLDDDFFDLLEFLREHYFTDFDVIEIEEASFRVFEEKDTVRLDIYGVGGKGYEQIYFPLTRLIDTDSSHLVSTFSPIRTDYQAKIKKPTSTEPDIISICREIVNASDQASEKIKQLRDLLNQ